MDPLIVPLMDGFEEIEFSAPVDILRRLDIPVISAGVESRRVEGAHGIVVEADMLLVDVDPALYSGIMIPGGPASWKLRDTAAVIKLVQQMNAAGKLVAAICAAPIVLQKAGVLRGRHITAYPDEEVLNSLTDAAEVTSMPDLRDGNIVTGRGPGAAFAFGFAVAEYMGVEPLEIESMKQAMVIGG